MSRVMSGHLEDLDLDEVIRLIGLSRRSGLLDIDAAQVRLEMHFVHGRLVRARASDALENVGTLLVRLGVLNDDDVSAVRTGDTLDEVVKHAQRARGDRALLVRVDDLMAEQITGLAHRAQRLRRGSFVFRVTLDEEAPDRFVSDTAFTLPAGIDAEDLAGEARRRRISIVPRASSLSIAPDDPSVPMLLVQQGDDALVSSVVQIARDAGVMVAAVVDARDAVDKLALLRGARETALLTSLVMPRADGRGVLGGLEVLREAVRNGVADRVFLVTDEAHDDAALRVVEHGGGGLLMRPHTGVGVHGEEAAAALLAPVLARLRVAPVASRGFHLAREVQRELDDDDRAHGSTRATWRNEWNPEGGRITDEASRNLHTLKAFLAELSDPGFDGEIPLLILRFAACFFSRGALFAVHRDARDGQGELVGLGGFGVTSSDPGRLVRSIRVPLEADTFFARALKEMAGVRMPPFDSEWNAHLLAQLGGPRPRAVYVAPVPSPRGVEAVLYADNAGDARGFPDVVLLEIFLQQAGAAIERATLARTVDALRASQLPTAATSTAAAAAAAAATTTTPPG